MGWFGVMHMNIELASNILVGGIILLISAAVMLYGFYGVQQTADVLIDCQNQNDNCLALQEQYIALVNDFNVQQSEYNKLVNKYNNCSVDFNLLVAQNKQLVTEYNALVNDYKVW